MRAEPPYMGLVSLWRASQAALVVKNPPANAGDRRDAGPIPGLGRPPGGGHGHPLQYSCLVNPTDRGAWRATIRKVAKSRTRLKRLSTHTYPYERDLRERSAPCFVRPPWKDHHRETDARSVGALILDFPASRTVENTFPWFLNHSVYGSLLKKLKWTKMRTLLEI